MNQENTNFMLSSFPRVNPDAGWLTVEMECDKCGRNFISVSPYCEWVDCRCGHWVQVPPRDDAFMYLSEIGCVHHEKVGWPEPVSQVDFIKYNIAG